MVSNMSSLMDLVSQNQPHFQTHQALLVIGLQNDFVLPDGRLPVNTKKGFLDRIQALIPKFRELNGNVIWVQTLYEADRIATDANTGEGDALVVGGLIDGDESSTEGGDEELIKDAKDLPPTQSRSSKHKQRALDLLKRVSARRKTMPQEVAKATAEEDDELFLLKSEKKTPAVVPNTYGAEFADVIARQFELPADAVIRTTNYSAFQGTSLLMTLRARLVTELYICGCITNVSVLATVIDAARHGIRINVVEDCLGYRKQTRHDLALKRMEDFFDAYLVTSTDIMAKEAPASPPRPSSSPNSSRTGSKAGEKPIEALVGRMSLNDEARSVSRPSNARSPSKILSGKPRTLSLVSVAESRKTKNSTTESNADPIAERTPEPTDKEFSEMLVKGASVPGAEERETEKPNLVKTKIRMRSNQKKKKKKDKDAEGEALKKKSESAAAKLEPVATGSTPSTRPADAPQTPTEERTSRISKAESSVNLREKEIRQALKSVASVPVLSAKTEEKERNRLSDLSDRVRLSLSRAAKSDTGSDAKRGSSSNPSKAAIIPTKMAEKAVTALPEKVAKNTTVSQSGSTQTNETPTAERPVEVTQVTSAESPTPIKASKLQSLANLPVLGPDDIIGEGDSRILHDFLPTDLKPPTDTSKAPQDLIFTQLYNEVRWQKMLHQQGEVPRLVCCQGAFGEDGSMPIYRHPSDQTLPLLHFSPKVQVIKKQAEKLVGHPLNHVLIQLYRSGNDYISEHSDKTLDIVKGSSIVNISFGAQRTMRLRTKKTTSKNGDFVENDSPRETQRVALPHNSMFVLGLSSNAKWLHGIMPDKRLASERSPAEIAYNGIRISLTFRHIGTFIDAKERSIWGQGATAKDPRDAADVINGDADEAERLIRAFGAENRTPDFDWPAQYGHGFDVLHLHDTAAPDLPLLFASTNPIETHQAQIALHEAKLSFTLVPAPDLHPDFKHTRPVALRDTDAQHTEVETAIALLLYLDRYHPLDTSPLSHASTAAAYPTMLLAARVLTAWQTVAVPADAARLAELLDSLEEQLSLQDGAFVSGSRFSIADCFVWPIVHALVAGWEGWSKERYAGLEEWYRGVWRRKGSVRKVVGRLEEKVEEGE